MAEQQGATPTVQEPARDDFTQGSSQAGPQVMPAAMNTEQAGISTQLNEARGRSRRRMPIALFIVLVALGIATTAFAATCLYKYVIAPAMEARQGQPARPVDNPAELSASTGDGTQPPATADTQAATTDGQTTIADTSTVAYDDDYIAFDMPAIWEGHISSSAEGHGSGAFHSDFLYSGADGLSCWVWRVDGGKGVTFYDAAGADGRFWSEYPARDIWTSTHGGSSEYGLSAEQQEEWLLMTCGGLVTRDELAAMDSEDAAVAAANEASAEFYAATVGDSLRLAS